MPSERSWLAALLPTLLLLSGCGPTTPTAADTGARAAAQGYFDALVRQDWGAAYETLDPAVRARWRAEEFTRRVTQYRRGLGFEPEKVAVRSCEERGDEATAHVVISGQAAGKARRFSDAVTLRRTGTGWTVVPPERFGQRRP
jgi:hypothetical protein